MNLQTLLSVALIVMMFAMGLGLQWDDFRRLLRQPRLTLSCLFAQMVILPMFALIIGKLVGLGPAVATGLLLVALCPSGSTSNFFSRLGNGNAALSVSLTAVNSLVTVFTLPLILLSIAPRLGYHNAGVSLSFWTAVVDIGLHTLLPVFLGMSARAALPALSRRFEPTVVALSTLLFFGVIVFLWQQNWSHILRSFETTGIATLILLASAMLMGWLSGLLIRASHRDRYTMMIEVGVQNGAMAFFIAMNLLKDPALVGPPTVYSVAMVLAALPFVFWRKTALLKKRA